MIATSAVVLLLAGCGASNADQAGESSAAPATPTATVTTPPTAQRYPTVEALKDAAEAAGLPCSGWVQDNIVTDAAESGHCTDEDVFTTYITDADLQAAVENARGMNELLREKKIDPGPTLIGPNWMINAPTADKLAEKLGGTVQR
jgi:hypothetical protein